MYCQTNEVLSFQFRMKAKGPVPVLCARCLSPREDDHMQALDEAPRTTIDIEASPFSEGPQSVRSGGNNDKAESRCWSVSLSVTHLKHHGDDRGKKKKEL